MLLSFEIDEARRTTPRRNEIGGQNEASGWREAFLKRAKCSILALFEIVRVPRRRTAITKVLSAKRRFTVSEVHLIAARLRKVTTTSPDRITMEEIGIATYGLRNIVVCDFDRHHSVLWEAGCRTFRRRATDDVTLLSMIVCLNGTDAAYPPLRIAQSRAKLSRAGRIYLQSF